MAESLAAFSKRVGFLHFSQADQVRALAWYLHEAKQRERVVTADIRECFQELHLDPPNVSRYLSYLSEGKGRAFIRDKKGFRLEGKTRARLAENYGDEVETITVRKMLSDAVQVISDEQQRIFADEALRCYSVKAFRAAIVMAWNLAYDHLCRWIHADAERLDNFKQSYAIKCPKSKVDFSKFVSFSDETEYNVVETAQHARLVTKNIGEMLKEKLKRRNAAAHPSSIVITQAQAEDVITDLLSNIIEKLK